MPVCGVDLRLMHCKNHRWVFASHLCSCLRHSERFAASCSFTDGKVKAKGCSPPHSLFLQVEAARRPPPPLRFAPELCKDPPRRGGLDGAAVSSFPSCFWGVDPNTHSNKMSSPRHLCFIFKQLQLCGIQTMVSIFLRWCAGND